MPGYTHSLCTTIQQPPSLIPLPPLAPPLIQAPHSAFPSTLPNQDSQCTCLLEAMRSASHTHFSSLGYRSITFMSFTELSFAPCKSKINDVWGLGEQCLYIGETCYMYSRMTTAGQVCAGHTHAPRLEGKSSCPAGGTCPKGKAKAKDGLPLPECPSKPGCGVSHLWRGTHLEGTLEDTFGYVSDYTHKRSQLIGLERTFGIACHAQPFSLLKSLPQYVNVCVQLHGAMTRVLAQQNRTYTVHVLFFAVLKQLKEAAVFPEEHGCVILSQCIEHVSACCFNCVYL